ncbi:MAG: N-acetyl sugar amidotransferase [Rubrivivax sp.]
MAPRVCTFCVMDEQPGIEFNASGQCSACRDAISRRPHEWWPNEDGRRRLNAMASVLREQGRGKTYDAMIGLSGGVDSAYLAHLAVRELGLRVLAVHVDGGWNSEPAVRNIESLVRTLDLDLHTYVVEWREMRDLQVSFLRASVLNQDIPQDHVFFTTLYRTARTFDQRHFLSGVNYATESVVPSGFGFPYSDDRHLLAIHQRFGTGPLDSYPVMSLFEFLWLTRIRKQLTVHRPLNYIFYRKDDAVAVLKRDYNWKDYGGKHSESRFTKFYQDIYLPRKFAFDKRRLHLSSLIVSGQITRKEALLELTEPPLSSIQIRRDIKYISKKLGLSAIELDELIDAPAVAHTTFPNRMELMRSLTLIKGMLRGMTPRRSQT